MKDYITKKDPNLEALIARYKEPEPTAEPEPVSELKPEPRPEPNHQASVTFVDAGGKPLPKLIAQDEPRVAVKKKSNDDTLTTVLCAAWLWSMATGAAYVAKGPSVIGPSVSTFIGLWILCAFVASVQKHGG